MATGRRVPTGLTTILLLMLPFGATARSAHADDEQYEHEHYLFRLRRPGPKWLLLSEHETKKMNPSATVGAIAVADGAGGVVIVEYSPSTPLGLIARAAVEAFPMEDPTEAISTQAEVAGRDAVRVEVLGTTKGVRYAYRFTFIERQGFVYQVISWRRPSKGNKGRLAQAAFERSFDLLPGKVRQPPAETSVVDASGLDWRLRRGIYENALFGFKLRPLPSWRVLVGDELAKISPEAEVGLSSNELDCVLVISAEVIDASVADWIRIRRTEFMDSLRPHRSRAPVSWTVAGKTVQVSQFETTDGHRVRHWLAFLVDGDVCYGFSAFCDPAVASSAEPKVREAISAFEFLSDEDVARLRLALASTPDVSNAVGIDFSLRRGIYRDFAFAFSWTRQSTRWRVTVGEGARAAFGPQCRLLLEQPRQGLTVIVACERGTSLTQVEYHARISANIWRTASPPVEKTALGGIPALMSSGKTVLDGKEFEVEMTSLVRKTHAVRLVVLSSSQRLSRHWRPIEGAKKALTFYSNGLKASHREANVYSDLRIGFRLRAARPNSKFLDLTPPHLVAIGATIAWHSTQASVTLTAVCPTSKEWDAEAMKKLLIRGVLTTADEKDRELLGAPEDAVFKGREATVVRSSEAGKSGGFVAFVANRTVYMVGLDDRVGGQSKLLPRLDKLFDILDR